MTEQKRPHALTLLGALMPLIASIDVPPRRYSAGVRSGKEEERRTQAQEAREQGWGVFEASPRPKRHVCPRCDGWTREIASRPGVFRCSRGHVSEATS